MLAYAGSLDEAQQILDTLVAEDPENIQYRGERGLIAARRGDSVLAMQDREWLASLDQRLPSGWDTFYRGLITAELGELEVALDLLWQAFAEGQPYGAWMEWDGYFDSLRDYPPFQEWLRPKG